MEKHCYVDNKYLLTVMVAKRAKQLNQGSKPLVKTNGRDNRSIAFKEIEQCKVYLKEDEDLDKE